MGSGAHLAQYGHAIHDLDFAVPLPADDPAPLEPQFYCRPRVWHPTVLSAGVATRPTRRGQMITLDGDAGTVTPLGESDTEA